MAFVNGADQFPIYVNTAAWSGLGSSVAKGAARGVGSNGTNPVLSMYGPLREYYPVQSDNCPENHGVCSDGTRWAIWPDTTPTIASATSTRVTAYSWIAKWKLQGLSQLNNPPPFTLYKQVYTGTTDRNKLPTVTVVRNVFWNAGEIGFGSYGSVVRNGIAYLYGKTVEGQPPALARVAVGQIENKSAYQYWVSGRWTNTAPKLGDQNAIVPNCGAGWQGTYYFSTYYNSYIWIGQKYGQPVAWFYISTAPAPQGPWVEPYLLYKGQDGDGFVGAYSLQAHPGLLPSKNAAENAIYLTHTQVFSKVSCTARS